MDFSELGLSPDILRAVSDAGYVKPTPIQEQAIPYVLQGRDMLGCAQTGTGKTAGFTLPMIEILAAGRAKARMPRSLILEPTRELAAQVSDNFEVYGKYHKLSMALLIGGVSFTDQESKLDRGVDVLIATPGRLLDHFERGKVLLNDVKILVIDEADRMLDMGFIPDVERIVSLLPRMRQTLFFSATMAPEIRRLADAFLMNPKEVAVAPPASPATTVTQGLVRVADRDKRDALRRLIRSENVRNALIFCNRKRDVAVLHKSLVRHGFSAAALHGDMHQSDRMETLEKFRHGQIQLLVCSDVAARGLDIAFLSHVFNFDVPMHAEDYIHRIGRTGRAGREGRAFMLATSADSRYLAAIEQLIGKQIPRVELPGLPANAEASDRGEATAEPDARARKRDRHGRGGRRRGKPDLAVLTGGAAEVELPLHGRADAEHGGNQPSTEAAPRVEAPRAEPARQHFKRDAKRQDHRPDRQSGRRDERREREEPPVVGLGDHVPAFLLRPVRISAKGG